MAISARSRRSRTVSVGMLSISCRHSSPSSTGVLPVFTTCFGPRTAAAGLIGTTWPVTSQSNSMRTAASCCFTSGAECVCCSCLDIGGDVERPDRASASGRAPRTRRRSVLQARA